MNFKIINFSTSGGIKQFTEYFIKECFRTKDIEVLNSNNFKEVYNFIKIHKDTSTFIFTNNNMKIYYFILYGLKFKSILILHDHKLRNGARIREKLLHFFIYKFIQKFEKVIIHNKDNKLLEKYPNLVYKKMPYHNGKVIETNKNKINLLFFGRIESYKNIDMLVKSFDNISLQNKFNLIIAGSGNLAENTLKKIKKNNITLINQFIDDRTRDVLIDWCHYFVLPYNSLTQTGIIDMAGYYKKPSLISNIQAFNEYKGKSFKNVLNINSIDELVLSFVEIYDDYFINYNEAEIESYSIYLNSFEQWKNYEKIFKGIK